MIQVEKLSAALRRAAEAAIEESARAACEQARALAPVDTGRLRKSIAAQCSGLTARVSTDCEYAAAVELGAAARPPKPFLLPAAQAERMRMAERAADRVKKELKG